MNVLDWSVPYMRHFEEMTRIPHGSFNEKPYSDYLVKWAEEHNLRYVQDELYNVIIYKPASVGYEDHAPVILQAHMDMVCAKTPDSKHDFKKDPLGAGAFCFVFVLHYIILLMLLYLKLLHRLVVRLLDRG